MGDSKFNLPPAALAELTATCDSIGYNDGVKVYLDKNTLEVIKDLIRFLRKDIEDHSVRRYLGQSKILQKDLIKIFVDEKCDEELWNVLLRLIINLTCPASMLFKGEVVPTDKEERTLYGEILTHLQEYKSALANDNIWSVVYQKLQVFLSVESSERTEENEMMIERILTFIRNVLRVPPNENEKRTDNDPTVHDEVLFAFHTSGIIDLILYIASSRSEQHYHMQILEITSHLLQSQKPESLAKAEIGRSITEKQQDEAKLLVARKKEKEVKMEKIKKYAGTRHSRFGGTYTVQNMKAIGDNELICHKPYRKIDDLDFNVRKIKLKKRKMKNSVADLDAPEHISALSVRLFLKEFCVEFLNGAYNPVMRFARSSINSGDSASASDATYYLWAIHFFMNFNRHYKFQVKYVSETISTEIFYIVQRQIEDYNDRITTDKARTAYWAKRLHYGINAYEELLLTVMQMDKSTDEGVKNSAKVIMSNIFYVPEYRQTILSQLINYSQEKMTKSYLVDLVTTTHIFMKMLKNFCDKQRSVIVQTGKRKRTKKSKKPKKSNKDKALPTLSLEERWDTVGPELSAVMQTTAFPEVMPFDATIDKSIEDQKEDAMIRIQKFLREKQYEHAVGLLRTARTVWPEGDSFGETNVTPEQEFLILREIFFADLGVADPQSNQSENNEDAQDFLNNEDGNDYENEEEDEEVEQEYRESDFNFMDYLRGFAHEKVIHAMAIILKDFDKNSIELNHYALKMLHRIAIDCKMSAMMFQASIFRIFQRIFESKRPEHKELERFARFIFRQFAECAAGNPKAYMELFFWKSTKLAREMVDGYEADSCSSRKKVSANTWTDAEEDELRTLFMEHQTKKPHQDLIDYIMENLIRQDRTSRAVMKKMKEMYLIVNSKETRKAIQKRLPKEWGEDEVAQLTELWTDLKENEEVTDIIGMIHELLRIKRPKSKIKEKLLELNLAQDKKEFRRKRVKKNKSGKSSWEAQSASDGSDSYNKSRRSSDSDDSSDDDDGGERNNASTRPNNGFDPGNSSESDLDLPNVRSTNAVKSTQQNGSGSQNSRASESRESNVNQLEKVSNAENLHEDTNESEVRIDLTESSSLNNRKTARINLGSDSEDEEKLRRRKRIKTTNFDSDDESDKGEPQPITTTEVEEATVETEEDRENMRKINELLYGTVSPDSSPNSHSREKESDTANNKKPSTDNSDSDEEQLNRNRKAKKMNFDDDEDELQQDVSMENAEDKDKEEDNISKINELLNRSDSPELTDLTESSNKERTQINSDSDEEKQPKQRKRIQVIEDDDDD